MPTLELQFPAGRFHATPWGRQVNEGAVEWPPSPWRLLRAFIATWHLKARDDVPEEQVAALIDALAASQPGFQLPPATLGHTRHYMPYNEGKNAKTTKVFDTFVQIAPETCVRVRWDVELAPELAQTFALLADRLGYCGRAEGLVLARVVENGGDFKANAEPLADDDIVGRDRELVRVLLPRPAEDFAQWRADFVAKAESALGPKPTAKQKAKVPTVPADLFAALHADTGDLQAAGWNLPPGAVFVNYTRDARCVDVAPIPRRKTSGRTLTVARFAVASAVLPRVTQTLSVAERIHQSLVKFSGSAPVFIGKHADGSPMTRHEHAHIFCETNGSRDEITHVTLHAPMGFDDNAARALRQLRRVWGHGGHELQLVLLGLGEPADFPEHPLFVTSHAWQSTTPFIPTRHTKTRGPRAPRDASDDEAEGTPKHDLRRLAAAANLPPIEQIERLKTVSVNGRELRCLQFQTRRRHGEGSRAPIPGCAFRIVFSEEVTGPLALGYGAHFGLGLFALAVNDNLSLNASNPG